MKTTITIILCIVVMSSCTKTLEDYSNPVLSLSSIEWAAKKDPMALYKSLAADADIVVTAASRVAFTGSTASFSPTLSGTLNGSQFRFKSGQLDTVKLLSFSSQGNTFTVEHNDLLTQLFGTTRLYNYIIAISDGEGGYPEMRFKNYYRFTTLFAKPVQNIDTFQAEKTTIHWDSVSSNENNYVLISMSQQSNSNSRIFKNIFLNDVGEYRVTEDDLTSFSKHSNLDVEIHRGNFSIGRHNGYVVFYSSYCIVSFRTFLL